MVQKCPDITHHRILDRRRKRLSTSYLDSVEMSLLTLVSSRSDSFFSQLQNLQVIDADGGTHTNTLFSKNTDTDTDTDTNPDTENNTDTDTRADTDADTDADGGTHINTNQKILTLPLPLTLTLPSRLLMLMVARTLTPFFKKY